MIISKNKHLKILQELKETHQEQLEEIRGIIDEQEKEIESLTDKVSDMVDQINVAKAGANHLLSLLDFKGEDAIIANVTNFLMEQGNEDAAKVISKCKMGKVKIVFCDYDNRIAGRYWFIDIYLSLFCPGYSYNILMDRENSITKKIKECNSILTDRCILNIGTAAIIIIV